MNPLAGFIYVLRHGSTALDPEHRSDGRLDLPLSDEGRGEVVGALDHLRNIPITCIYAAPQKRTRETAEILKSGINSDPDIEMAPEALTWNLGSLSGAEKKPNKQMVTYLHDHPSVKAPHGESYGAFCARFDKWLDKQKTESATDGPFLLVLSGSNNRRISERLFKGDRSMLNMGEAGLYLLYSDDGTWTASVIADPKSSDEEQS